MQGLGSALMTPVGRILVLRNASKSELLNATALITWPALFAPVVGPVLGGFITTYLSWHWNFFINMPLGLIGLALVARFIPGDREAEPKPLDWPGFFLTSLGLAVLLYGLERIAHPEDGVLPTVLLIAAGIVIGWLAVRHLRRAPASAARPLLVQGADLRHLDARRRHHLPGGDQRHAVPAAAAVPGRLRPLARRCRPDGPGLFPRQSRHEDGDDADAAAFRLSHR